MPSRMHSAAKIMNRRHLRYVTFLWVATHVVGMLGCGNSATPGKVQVEGTGGIKKTKTTSSPPPKVPPG